MKNEKNNILKLNDVLSIWWECKRHHLITPLNPQSHLKSFKLTPPYLRVSLSAMKRTNKKTKRRGKTSNKRKRGAREATSFLKVIKYLGWLLRSTCFMSLSWPLPPNKIQRQYGRYTSRGVELCSGIHYLPSTAEVIPRLIGIGREESRGAG